MKLLSTKIHYEKYNYEKLCRVSEVFTDFVIGFPTEVPCKLGNILYCTDNFAQKITICVGTQDAYSPKLTSKCIQNDINIL